MEVNQKLHWNPAHRPFRRSIVRLCILIGCLTWLAVPAHSFAVQSEETEQQQEETEQQTNQAGQTDEPQTAEAQQEPAAQSGTEANNESPARSAMEEEDLSRLRPDEPAEVSPGELEDSIARAARSLIDTQRRDGAWGGPQWTGGVDRDPVGTFDAFDVAVTAMCLEALLDLEETEELVETRKKAYEFLLSESDSIRRADGGNLPHIWSYCYCIQTFAKIYQRETDEQERSRLAEAIAAHVRGLDRWQSINGGWFYYGNGMAKPTNPSCSFVNAAVLVALARARDVGLDVNDEMVQKALRATQLMRKPDSSFLYTAQIPGDMTGAAHPINRPAGSLGRSQAGNIALRLWNDEDITDEVIQNWLNRLVTRHGWLDIGRKRRLPHIAPAAVSGYFYYFGMYYGAVCMEALPEPERPFYQHHLARLIIDRQEPDGSWFDYPLYSYHKPYGTAFAMLALQRCRVDLEQLMDR